MNWLRRVRQTMSWKKSPNWGMLKVTPPPREGLPDWGRTLLYS